MGRRWVVRDSAMDSTGLEAMWQRQRRPTGICALVERGAEGDRPLMQTRSDATSDRKRAHVETVMSMIKRRQSLFYTTGAAFVNST